MPTTAEESMLLSMKQVPLLCMLLLVPATLLGQGVTTSAINGLVISQDGSPLAGATVLAVHLPSGTQYRATVRSGGAFGIPNMRIGGPYRVTATMIGFQPRSEENVFLSLGQNHRIDFGLIPQAVTLEAMRVVAERDPVLNAGRTGAATFIDPALVATMPSVKRSTRDLTRLDPRSDGNMSFGGRNWLYNNISLDGSYFNNPYGLDDPAPGGQTNAEPVPFDAVEQVQVSLAPFDVRQGGFTGANINTVTKSGTNEFRGSAYSFLRNDALQGNKVSGSDVIANPDLSFNQSGLALGGPIIRDKLFFYLNGEIERTDDPGTNFVARRGAPGFGISRVEARIMDSIRTRMMTEYNYDPGAYEGYIHETDNDKLLLKLDWNVNSDNNFTIRYNYLDAKRDLPPHPFVLSFGNTGRGPNESSLPFQNSGYTISNNLHSVALELNSRSTRFANRFFASYNRFRDARDPFSEDFPTIEIGEEGVTYTTIGHEPFSIHNILDQDVLQFTNNFDLFRGKHVFTIGANFESFRFFNSFNIFRHGVFFFPAPPTSFGQTFSSLDEFFNATDPNNPDQIDFRSLIGTGLFKGEDIHTGQFSIYGQDEFLVTPRFNLTYGLRVDFPIYFTKPVDNPFSRGLSALDENRAPETVDQSRLPGSDPLLSPRVGFNWNAVGERRTQLRGGTGIFTGRVPFVWFGNVISNPGANPNLFPTGPERRTSGDATLAQSFDVNAMVPDFKWPQVWTTDIAVDQQLPWNMLGTLELIYGKDINAVFMRNADLVAPVRTLPAPDGRPFYGGFGNNELNPDFGAGIYVIDNTDDGYSFSATAQLRKAFPFNARAGVGYSFTHAKNSLKSTEIASVLWQNQPVQGDPNNPGLSYSEFGQRHRIVGDATYTKEWSPNYKTQIGMFLEVGQGNRFGGAGGNRYSFIYSGDVNGDGQGGNDLIYIPRSQSEIQLVSFVDANGNTVSAQEQWTRLDAFIEQDDYLREHRGQIAERFGALNPWFTSVDLRILQDFAVGAGGKRHALQLSVDVLNVGNLLSSDWGVRKVASVAATSPLTVTPLVVNGAPVFNFTGPAQTFIDDPNLLSRWRAQIGLRYLFN
ncbi:MAG: carboxypeptidase regulatory-like domain-containing protein [Gemmatimonadaceae bacterium]